jgi:hypothetical protein
LFPPFCFIKTLYFSKDLSNTNPLQDLARYFYTSKISYDLLLRPSRALSIFIRRLRDAEVNILLFIVLSIISGILIPIGNPITIIIGVILVLLLLFVLFFKKGNMSAECVVSVSTNEKDEGSDL